MPKGNKPETIKKIYRFQKNFSLKKDLMEQA